MEALLAWVEEADKCGAPFDLLALAMVGNDQVCTSLANDLEESLSALRSAFVRVSEIVRPSATEIFGIADIEQVPLHAVLERLEAWAKGVNEFNDWVSARDALGNLVSMKMDMIAEGLNDGSIEPSESFAITELHIAEALWGRARLDDPSLDQIDGTQRSEVVSQFRALDRRRIQLARSEVLARYLERRPSGEAGEMGVVRAEIGKKRRHLPIRKLTEQAGSAVQKLKPVFLMSPLSVAQFLPPGRMNFDLVVIDEASQVPPAEALGVLARGRQMAIVGDDKQLPPTNFFKMVSDDDDEEKEGDQTVTTGRTRDFESVLKLACDFPVPEGPISKLLVPLSIPPPKRTSIPSMPQDKGSRTKSRCCSSVQFSGIS